MKKEFHQSVVEIALNSMSAGFKEKFLADFPFELVREYADVPYTSDRFDDKYHTDHSYRLYLKGRDLHKIGEGDSIAEIVNFAQATTKVSDPMLVRYNIVKATHYLVDLCYPHVVETLWDKYHDKFEDQAANWLDTHRDLVEQLCKDYKPTPMRSVQNRCRAFAEEMYFDALDFLPVLKRNAYATDLQWATMVMKHIYIVMDWFATWERYL